MGMSGSNETQLMRRIADLERTVNQLLAPKSKPRVVIPTPHIISYRMTHPGSYYATDSGTANNGLKIIRSLGEADIVGWRAEPRNDGHQLVCERDAIYFISMQWNAWDLSGKGEGPWQVTGSVIGTTTPETATDIVMNVRDATNTIDRIHGGYWKLSGSVGSRFSGEFTWVCRMKEGYTLVPKFQFNSWNASGTEVNNGRGNVIVSIMRFDGSTIKAAADFPVEEADPPPPP